MAIQGKESENGVYEFPYFQPPKRSRGEECQRYLWNPTTGEVLGRTATSWAKIALFYLVFYAVLAALFSVCMQGLLATINHKTPTWTAGDSLIGTNPGLGFRPISNETEEGSLIWYNTTRANYTKWSNFLDEFLAPYKNSTVGGTNQHECSFTKLPKEGDVCSVNVTEFGPCSPDYYGYDSASPCVFLKLNRIYNWIPEYYNNTRDRSQLPEDMPDDLKDYITHNVSATEANQVWVSCKAENPGDMENLYPQFNYFPTRGFPGFFYPYTNEQHYLSPLVAVQINLRNHNVIVNIECRAWAKNIFYRGGGEQREGSIHFEVMRDLPPGTDTMRADEGEEQTTLFESITSLPGHNSTQV